MEERFSNAAHIHPISILSPFHIRSYCLLHIVFCVYIITSWVGLVLSKLFIMKFLLNAVSGRENKHGGGQKFYRETFSTPGFRT